MHCPTHISILTLIILILETAGFSGLLFLLNTIHEHPRSIFFPQQEILMFHTQNMNHAKLYFIHFHSHLVRCKQENQKTKMALRVEGSTLVNSGTERKLSNHFSAMGHDHAVCLYNRSTASLKASSSFNLQYFLVFLVSFSS
jgi:hypothetical protein